MKWGIIGTGKIARRFANDLMLVPGAELAGVTSRQTENLNLFSTDFKTKGFATIEELLSSDVEIIYVATPHSSHKDHALMAINAGKAVLCEKPFAMDFSESLEMINLAKMKNVFLMEAMWTRFFPALKDAIVSVNSGEIGELVRIESNFGYSAPFDPTSRVFSPELGGGSLLDVGVYSIALARMFVPEMPVEIRASAIKASTGVDESASWTLRFPSGVSAKGKSSVVKILQNEALITGTKGEIRIPRFWNPKEYYLNGEHRTFDYEGMGFQFEAEEVMSCLKRGLTESPLVSHFHTLDVMKILDEVQSKIIWRET